MEVEVIEISIAMVVPSKIGHNPKANASVKRIPIRFAKAAKIGPPNIIAKPIKEKAKAASPVLQPPSSSSLVVRKPTTNRLIKPKVAYARIRGSHPGILRSAVKPPMPAPPEGASC